MIFFRKKWALCIGHADGLTLRQAYCAGKIVANSSVYVEEIACQRSSNGCMHLDVDGDGRCIDLRICEICINLWMACHMHVLNSNVCKHSHYVNLWPVYMFIVRNRVAISLPNSRQSRILGYLLQHCLFYWPHEHRVRLSFGWPVDSRIFTIIFTNWLHIISQIIGLSEKQFHCRLISFAFLFVCARKDKRT